MSAEVDTIRRAAQLMRERVQDVTYVGSRWEVSRRDITQINDKGGNLVGFAEYPGAAYIAAMHPGVALVVADLLDKIARQHRKLTGDKCGQGYLPTGKYGYVDPSCSHCGTPDEYAQPWPCEPINDALAIARAYLGDDQ